MKVLITGISGFIGQYLSKRLAANGYEVHGLYQEGDIRPYTHIADLRDKDAIEAIIKEVQPDYIIHLAAKTEVALSFDNYTEVSDVNYLGTINLAEANRKYNPNLKLFVMASTMETYGHQDPANGPFTEDTPQKPMAPYAVAKLACEKYLYYMQYAYQFPFTILRQTNAYGRTDNDFFVVERIITQMLDSNDVYLGEPTPVRNFIWIDDLIDLYCTLLEKSDVAQGETFVVGPDNGLSIEALASKIAHQLDWGGNIHWNQRKDGLGKLPGEIYYLNSVATKAKELLGWQPQVSLDDGIGRTIDIWRQK